MSKLKEVKSEFTLLTSKELVISGIELAGLIQSVLSKDGCFRIRVGGYSMSPFIRNNDVVIVSRLVGSLGIGRIVAFIDLKAGKPIIHRVVGLKRKFFLVKGDNNFKPDGWIAGENILGYITKIERNGRNISFGLGKSRLLIALFSRIGILSLLSKFSKIPIFFRQLKTFRI